MVVVSARSVASCSDVCVCLQQRLPNDLLVVGLKFFCQHIASYMTDSASYSPLDVFAQLV